MSYSEIPEISEMLRKKKKKRSFMKRKWYKAEYKKAIEEMETIDRF